MRKAWLPLGLLTLLGLVACDLLAPESSIAAGHPTTLVMSRPICSECHGRRLLKGGHQPYAAYDHTSGFVTNHRLTALQGAPTCGVCHPSSYCADCHGARTVMNPAKKLGNRPDRATPHPSEYLALHRMDGRADPTGCFPCHGRANNGMCRACHR